MKKIIKCVIVLFVTLVACKKSDTLIDYSSITHKTEVSNLRATHIGDSILLNWTAPVYDLLAGYKVTDIQAGVDEVINDKSVLTFGFPANVPGVHNITVYVKDNQGNYSAGTMLHFMVTDIYIAGNELNPANNKMIAIYWKNGRPFSITDGENDASANSVYVSGKDVYVTGYEYSGAQSIAKYWKNGIGIALSDGSNFATATSIFVYGNDVHVAGYETVAGTMSVRYWKNGVSIPIESGMGFGTSIFVSGTDVFEAGYEWNGNHYVAKIWKNTMPADLSDGKRNAYASCLFVSNGDVYAAGWENNFSNKKVAMYWKNGMAYPLTNGKSDAVLQAIYIKNNDLYLAGHETNESNIMVGKYWKNGAEQILSDGTYDCNALSMAVCGNDVYVIGTEHYSIMGHSKEVSKCWKNGNLYTIGDESRNAKFFSICVIE